MTPKAGKVSKRLKDMELPDNMFMGFNSKEDLDEYRQSLKKVVKGLMDLYEFKIDNMTCIQTIYLNQDTGNIDKTRTEELVIFIDNKPNCTILHN